jgi:hypothetical protein
MKKLLSSKVASSYWFIYTLAFAFVLAILYVVFGQILTVYVYPTTIYLSNVSGTVDTVAPDKFLTVWGWVPYMIVLIILAFMYFRLTQSPSGE